MGYSEGGKDPPRHVAQVDTAPSVDLNVSPPTGTHAHYARRDSNPQPSVPKLVRDKLLETVLVDHIFDSPAKTAGLERFSLTVQKKVLVGIVRHVFFEDFLRPFAHDVGTSESMPCGFMLFGLCQPVFAVVLEVDHAGLEVADFGGTHAVNAL